MASEMQAYLNGRAKLGLHVIEYPSGRFGFVGRVPEALAYSGSAKDLATGRAMGMGLLIRSGRVKALSWESRDAALAYAAKLGFAVT